MKGSSQDNLRNALNKWMKTNNKLILSNKKVAAQKKKIH